jgi:hypothetical protein
MGVSCSGGYGIPKVSMGPAMPYPSTPCRWATPETALRLSSTPFDCHLPLSTPLAIRLCYAMFPSLVTGVVYGGILLNVSTWCKCFTPFQSLSESRGDIRVAMAIDALAFPFFSLYPYLQSTFFFLSFLNSIICRQERVVNHWPII